MGAERPAAARPARNKIKRDAGGGAARGTGLQRPGGVSFGTGQSDLASQYIKGYLKNDCNADKALE